VRSSGSHVSSIGHWYLDESVFEWGNDLIAALSDEDLIVIDELGPLEFEKSKGYQQALGLLDEGRYKLALVVVRPAILSLAQLRWPGAQSFSLEGVVR
jgi:nucleoside-triphosphatase THEP1